jgi:hypothetical protein
MGASSKDEMSVGERELYWDAYFRRMHPNFAHMHINPIVKAYLELFLKQHRRLPNCTETVDAMMSFPTNSYAALTLQFPNETPQCIRECSEHLFVMCGYLPRLHYITLAIHFRQLHHRLPTSDEMISMHRASLTASTESLQMKNLPSRIPIDITLIKHRIDYDLCQQDGSFCTTCQYDIEPGESQATLPCKHTFHADACLEPWIVNHNACPLCRRRIYRVEETHNAVNLLNSCTKFHNMYTEEHALC